MSPTIIHSTHSKNPKAIPLTANFSSSQSSYFLEKRSLNKGFGRMHTHTFFELELVLDGYGETCFNGVMHSFSRGTAYISRPTDTHSLSIQSPQNLEIWNLSFMGDALPDQLLDKILYYSGDIFFHLEETHLQQACTLFHMIYQQQKENTISEDRLADLCMEALFTFILRHLPVTTANTEDRVILKAVKFIHLHFRERLTQDDVAKYAGLSTPYFSSLFHAETGCHYKEYLTSLRVGWTLRLMKGSGVTPTVACYEAGFNSYSSFLNAFTRIVGISPREYYAQKHALASSSADPDPEDMKNEDFDPDSESKPIIFMMCTEN